MPTRAQAAKAAQQDEQQEVPGEEEQPEPQQELDQPIKPTASKLRETYQGLIANLEDRIAAFEEKEEWTDSDRESVERTARMLHELCSRFKDCHFVVIAGLESEQDLKREQEVLNKHENKTMEYIDRIGRLLKRLTPSDYAPSVKEARLVDRQLTLLEGSVRNISGALNARGVGKGVLTSYLDEIVGLKAKLEELKERILSLEDFKDR